MIISGRAQPNASVADAGVIYKTFRRLGVGSTLADLASALDFEPYGEFFNTFLRRENLCGGEWYASHDKLCHCMSQRWLSQNSDVLLVTRQSNPPLTTTMQEPEVQSQRRRP